MDAMTRQRRTYTSPKRAQESEATRTYILDAACELLQDKGYPHFSVDTIAAKAGVSRATIYVHFGSKSGVLQAVARRLADVALKNLMPDFLAAADQAPAFRSVLGRLFAFFGSYADLLRSLQAQTVYDPDYAALARGYQQEIWHNTRRAVEWLAGDTPLAAGWATDRAADWLWALTSFEMYDKLVIERGWPAETLVDAIMQTLAELLAGPGDRAHDGVPENLP